MRGQRVSENGLPRKFAIVSLPRSGSTSLARALNCFPTGRCLIEPFHPGRYRGLPHDIALHKQSVRIPLLSIWRSYNGIKHVWEATGWPFVEQPSLNEELLLQPDLHVILLLRRNYLQRYISNYLCRHTSYWIGERDEFAMRVRRCQLSPLHPDHILRQIEKDRNAVARQCALLRDQRVRTMTVYYEQLFSNDDTQGGWKSVFARILNFIEVPRSEAGMALARYHFDPSRKWASYHLYASLPGIRDIEDKVGSDANGWLFR
jgi:LPS sulfotransferase NodH